MLDILCSGRIGPVPMTRRNAPRAIVRAAAAIAACIGLPAHALTITPTYGTGIDIDAQAVINSTIAGYESMFSDNVSIAINFNSMTSGLGSSSTYLYQVSYKSYIDGLRADATSTADFTAINLLPSMSINPVTDSGSIWLTRANAQAVGLNVGGSPPDGDSSIGLNMGIINVSRASINPSYYDLQTVASHEIDEVLGTISGVGSQYQPMPMDLFRYGPRGTRSFTTAADAQAYFSIDGTTDLAQFNQDGVGDYGDFANLSHTDPASLYATRVQNAYGTPGTFANLGVEVTMLDVVGYTLSPVPENNTLALMAAGLALLGGVARRRNGA